MHEWSEGARSGYLLRQGMESALALASTVGFPLHNAVEDLPKLKLSRHSASLPPTPSNCPTLINFQSLLRAQLKHHFLREVFPDLVSVELSLSQYTLFLAPYSTRHS